LKLIIAAGAVEAVVAVAEQQLIQKIWLKMTTSSLAVCMHSPMLEWFRIKVVRVCVHSNTLDRVFAPWSPMLFSDKLQRNRLHCTSITSNSSQSVEKKIE
jgi:hypothetical protein